MSDNPWQKNIDSAPKDGTYIMVNGYIDTTKKDILINMPAAWNPHYKHWVTRRGQVIFPVKWKPIV